MHVNHNRIHGIVTYCVKIKQIDLPAAWNRLLMVEALTLIPILRIVALTSVEVTNGFLQASLHISLSSCWLVLRGRPAPGA